MTDDARRLAIVETKVENNKEDIVELKKTLVSLEEKLGEVLIAARAFKWMIAIAITLGPLIGSAFSYFIFKVGIEVR